MSVYDVCLLLERPLSRQDAEGIVDLHRDWPDPVHYHVLIPVVDAAAHVEAALGTLGAGEVMASAPIGVLEEDAERARQEAVEVTTHHCDQSVAALEALGADAEAEVVLDDPVDRLARAVEERGSSEVIILTRGHVIASLFHVDWTHQAQRRLGVPVLHLLAHRDVD